MEDSGKVISGLIKEEDAKTIRVMTNLLTPEVTTVVKKSQIEFRTASKISSMPEGLLNVLTKEEILDLVSYLEVGDDALPEHLRHQHQQP